LKFLRSHANATFGSFSSLFLVRIVVLVFVVVVSRRFCVWMVFECLVCDSFLGLGKSYASTTLGGFLIVPGFTCLCVGFLSVLWLFDMVCR
jgi:hypothetical protein